MKTLYTQSETCAVLGIRRKRLLTLDVEPVKIGRTVYYDEDQVNSMVAQLRERKQIRELTVSAVAKSVGWHRNYLTYHVGRGSLPVPRKRGRYYYWTQQEAELVREFVRRRQQQA